MSVDISALNERGQQLLKTLVERYIQEGTPVGSRTLARDSGLDLSAATIRNVMADLEDLGLVAAPHTSAGRVPTASGYQVFVDSLVTCQPIEDDVVERLRADFASNDNDPVGLRDRASEMLSSLTHLAGLVMTPKVVQTGFRHIEFLPLSRNRILVVLVTVRGEVHNQIIETDKQYSASELEQAANFLNDTYAGRNLESMRQALVKDLATIRKTLDARMIDVVSMASQMLDREMPDEPDYVVAGQTNLMQRDRVEEMEQLRELFDAFTEKQQILHLLERCSDANGVTVFIGGDSAFQTPGGFSLVAKPYTVNRDVIGVLAVVGPTRMAYDQAISAVDVTARLLGAALKTD